MQHVAIDLGGRESQICIRDETGQILEERKVATRALGRFLEKQPTSRVVVETCSEAFAIADTALSYRHEVRVVPATLVRSLGVGARGIKTDRRDARVLSETSCRIDLPSVHIPSTIARERRAMCTMREQLVATRTALISSARAWTRTQLLKLPSGEPETLPQRIREAALKHAGGLPDYVERTLVIVQALNEQLSAFDKEFEQLARQDPVCQLLMTVPGVGPVTSLRFVSAIDDISRFPNARSVEAFLGLTPGEKSSSERQHRTGITKAGPAGVRRALVQGAWNLRRYRPADPIAKWAADIELRRGKFVATVAVARKIAGVLFALWRDGTRYDPSHEARKQASA